MELTIPFQSITKLDQIVAFLDTKILNFEVEPDKRWIIIWNDYFSRIKYLFRWFYNTKNPSGFLGTIYPEENVHIPTGDWETPSFLNIDKKKAKRLRPFIATALWE